MWAYEPFELRGRVHRTCTNNEPKSSDSTSIATLINGNLLPSPSVNLTFRSRIVSDASGHFSTLLCYISTDTHLYIRGSWCRTCCHNILLFTSTTPDKRSCSQCSGSVQVPPLSFVRFQRSYASFLLMPYAEHVSWAVLRVLGRAPSVIMDILTFIPSVM